MKLNKVLTINGQARKLLADKVRLNARSPGAARFEMVADDIGLALNQLVTLDVGYSLQTATQRFFIGLVTDIDTEATGKVIVFCRELSWVLHRPLPLKLRHVTLADVLMAIEERTGLTFSVPDVAYAKRKVAKFFNVGSGYQALDALGEVFGIADYVWQQQAGKVFVGSWADSRWSGQGNFVIPDAVFRGKRTKGVAEIAALPQLRPGQLVNGQRLTNVTLQKSYMELEWISN
jgi:hypothetical protein